MQLPQKVVSGGYERWSFARGYNYRALTGKNVVSWIGDRLLDVVAFEVVAHGDSTVFTV